MIKEKTIKELLQEAIFNNSAFPEFENSSVDPMEKLMQMSDENIVSVLSIFKSLLEQGLKEIEEEKK